MLLKNSNAVDTVDRMGYIVLYCAAGVGNERATELLVKDYRANVEARNTEKGLLYMLPLRGGLGRRLGCN